MTDEAPRFTTTEPGHDPETDPASSFPSQPGGFGGAYEDRINYGVYNGAFAKGPIDSSKNITPYGQAGSNFMPHWRFVQSSNTNITLTHVRDTGSPSGSNARFTFVPGAANDEAYIEQLVPFGGSRARWTGAVARVAYNVVSLSANFFQVGLRLAYLDVNGAVVGTPATLLNTLSGTGGGTAATQTSLSASPPAPATHLRLWVLVRRNTATTTATAQIDIADVRLDLARPYIAVAESAAPSTYAAATLTQSNGELVITPAGGASAPELSLDKATGTATLMGSGGAYIDTDSAGEITLNSNTDVRIFEGIELAGATRIVTGTGTPEGVVTAPRGSLFLRTDGGATTTLYVKTSGTGNTGWTAK
jgi:hypothetical protein